MVSEEPRAATGAGSQEAPPTMERRKNPVVFDGQAGSRVADTENDDYLGEEAALPAENSKGKPGDIHSIRVQGFWHSLEIRTWLLQVLSEGYKLHLKKTLSAYRERNNASVRAEMGFVREQVLKLEERGMVKAVRTPPRCINPLSVAAKELGG